MNKPGWIWNWCNFVSSFQTFELQEETSPDSRRHLVSEVRRGTEGGATVKLDADGGMHTFQVRIIYQQSILLSYRNFQFLVKNANF